MLHPLTRQTFFVRCVHFRDNEDNVGLLISVTLMYVCVCVRMCARACARARVRACVCVCVCVCVKRTCLRCAVLYHHRHLVLGLGHFVSKCNSKDSTLIIVQIWLIEEFCLLGYNAMQSDERQPTFRRNVSPSSGSKNKRESRWQAELSRWYVARLILQPWRWRWHVPPKCLLTFNRLHDVISQR
jgi:hypothetical protein